MAGCLPSVSRLLVHLAQFLAVDRVARQVLGVAGAADGHLAHHLADDDLEVLVMDVLALRAVHLLDLAQQIHLGGFASLDAQDAVRVERAFGQRLAGFHMVAFLDEQAGGGRDFGGLLLALFVGNHDLAVFLFDGYSCRRAGR